MTTSIDTKYFSVLDAYNQFRKISAQILEEKAHTHYLKEDIDKAFEFNVDEEFGKWILNKLRTESTVKKSDLDLSEIRVYFHKLGAETTICEEKIKSGITYKSSKKAVTDIKENLGRNTITVLVENEIFTLTEKEAAEFELIESSYSLFK